MLGTRRAAITLALLSLLLPAIVAVTNETPARALTNCSVSDLSVDGEEAKFLTLINNYRAQNGLSQLAMSTNLNRSASWMVVDLATKNYFSHTDSLGRSVSTRVQDCGYPSGAGENLAAGTNRDTAQEAFDAWKASSGHNANMLNSSYRMIGIARYYGAGSTYGWYWATDFGLVDDGTSGSSGGATQSPAAVSSPSPGSTLPGTSATFSWNPAQGALEYFIYVGTTVGSNNIAGRSTGTATSTTVTNVPTNGSTVYVRLWTRFSTGWQYRDVTYRASTGSSTTLVKAALTSPSPGSTLPGSSATFAWSTGSGALEYFFYAGTSKGSNNITGRSTGTGTSTTITNLPTNGSSVYVRLWTRFSSGWQYTDYTYQAAGSAGTVQTKAALTSPAPGSQLPGTTATFGWTAGAGALEYFFYAGTVPGSNNIIGTSTGAGRSITVSNLPRGGGTVYVRLWTRFSTGWQYTDYTFRAAP